MSTGSDLPTPRDDELLVVVGPTASGKTELAVQLAQAHGGEVIGADSVQIYRRLDIGSGKPSAEQRRQVRHHLVDCVDPLAPFDAATYAGRAEQILADIRARGRVPIVCGGTFLWVKALLHGLAPAPPGDPSVRQRHHEWAERNGRAALHERLTEVDPATAGRLAPNDFVRVSRALEVYELSGTTLSAWHAAHGFRRQRHHARLLGVERTRTEIDERIEQRTAAWLEQGWIDEVAQLVADGYRECRALRSVGYRQVLEHVDGQLARDQLHAAIVQATRTFVRRQRTWLRDQTITWLAPRALDPTPSLRSQTNPE